MFRDGRRQTAGPVTVITAEGQPGPPRVGFVAGRNVGSAVVRNRAKRRLREAAAQAELKDGADYVVIASASVVEAPFRRLVACLEQAAGEGEGRT